MLFVFSESNIFEKSGVNLFQSDFISKGKTENLFELRLQVLFVLTLCIQFWWSGVLIGSGTIFKIKFAVTAFKKSSGFVTVNTISGLFDVIDDPPIRYGFMFICRDSAAFGICEKFVIWFFVISGCCK